MKNILKICFAAICLGMFSTACQNFEQPNLLGPADETAKNINDFDTQLDKLDNKKSLNNSEAKRIAKGLNKRVMRNFTKLKYDSTLQAYKGGAIHLEKGNGSVFQIKDKSITPPKSHKYGTPVTVTMQVTHDGPGNEMIFSFGPSGSKFSPSATIKLDYSLLSDDGNSIPYLYYIDKGGQYQLQQPDHIDCKKKFMTIKVDHFSRYAVAYGR